MSDRVFARRIGRRVLPHEMFHLVLPEPPGEQASMEEGLSTCLEPVARVRRGRRERA